MFRKLSTYVLFLLLALPGVALAQNTGKLAGQVIDATTGDPLPGAQVVVDGTSLGAATDLDGNYVILGIPVGQYDVEARFVGFETERRTGVEVSAGRTRNLDFALGEDTAQLDEVVVEYERPIIQRDAIGVPRVITGEDLQNLPVRGVTSVTAIQAGVASQDGSSTLNIRGGRGEEVAYYVDGVKVVGGSGQIGVPQSSIAEQEILIGTIPPQYGDATSGIVSISTRAGGNDFFGSFEAITSEALDAYGYNLASLSIGGPILPGRASFFLSGQGTFQSDSSPYSIPTLQLRDDVYNQLQQAPQVVQVPIGADITGATSQPFVTGDEFYYFSLPSTLPDSASVGDLAEALGLTAGDIMPAPENAWRFLSNDSFFNEVSGKDDPSQQLTFNGNLTLTPINRLNLRIGGAYTDSDNQGFAYGRSFFNRGVYSLTDDRTARIYGTLRQSISNTAFYQIQAEFTDRLFENYPEAFGSDIRDAIFYGDIDHPANAVAARYRQFNAAEGVYVPSFLDGQINPATEYSSFAAPGTPLSGYQRFAQKQFRVSGSATTQLGVHELSFGGEYEQLTQRNYTLGAGFSRNLARSFCDDLEAANCGAENINAIDTNEDGMISEDERVLAYDQLPFDVGFGQLSNTRYYGYDYLGLNEVDSQDIEGFAAGTNGNVAPYKPIYYGGYVRDRIEFRDLVIDLGLRLDVFDNNTLVLRDAFSLVDIYRGADVAAGDVVADGAVIIEQTDLPNGIDGDYAVYVAGTEVVGYRDLEGNFYDAAGDESIATGINGITALGQPKAVGDGALSAAAFEDYEPELTVMPRIGVTFPVTDQALFFASYNVTSSRPTENAFETIQGYESVRSGQGTLNNANLKPEITTQYELGFRQRLGQRAALTLSGFYRTQRNKITLRNINQGFPAPFTTYTNQDFTTTKGAELGFELRRTNNVAVNANYTLSFAEGTGSDSRTASIIAWRSPSGFFPNTLSPLDFDQRHNINLSVDYRLGEGEGPMVGGVRLLEGFGFNILSVFKSGVPYTQLDEQASGLPITNSNNGGAAGPINGVTTPWTSRIDLRVDRAFNLGPASLKGYIWVQNLLDQDLVFGVYRTTGEVNDDGFVASDPELINTIDTQIERDAYAFQYGQYVGGPVVVNGFRVGGNQLYGLPRRIRLGVILDF